MEFFGASHPVEVENFLTDNGVVIEDFVELAQFKEENLIKVVLFDVPILVHGGSEATPSIFRDE